jgi:hypothetical protein
MVMKDPLAGALPEQTNTASQPLTGLPSSMTGGVGTGMIPPQQSSGQSALAPVPSPGGNASVEGAPLSQNGANEPQGGAGANLNLVEPRDKPMPYWEGMMKKTGSKKDMELMSDSLNGSSGQTGKFAEGDPEDIRRAGSNLNQSMGINTAKDEATVREDLIVKPMVNAIVGEVDQQVIDLDEGGARIVGTIINSSEAGTIDEAAINDASKRAADELGLKGAEKKGFIGRTTTRMKKWWELGKDDPNTKEREDETVEVTRFMGGMSRQELGMFVFQWGGLLMANADKGFGAAAGLAGGGAMAGHQGRAVMAEESALKQEELGMRKEELGLKGQAADSQARVAASSALGKAYTDPDTGNYMIPEWSEKEKKYIFKEGKKEDGSPQKGPLDSANRPYATAQLQTQLESTGFYTPQEIAILIAKQPGPGVIRANALDSWERRMRDKIYPDGMNSSDWRDLSEGERDKFRTKFAESYVAEYMKAYDKEGGALPPIGSSDTDGKDAVDEYDTP